MSTRGGTGRKRSKIWSAVIAVLLVAAVTVMIFQAVRSFYVHDQSRREYDSLREKYVTVNETAKSDDSVSPLEADFDALADKNQDIRAWIYIDSLDISYPVVRGRDNYLYTNTTFLGRENDLGCIFIDYRADSGFEDPNTVIHGCAASDGSMFGSLQNLSEESDLPYIWIITPSHALRYKIFSIHENVSGIGIYSFFNGSDSGFVQYAEKMASESDKPFDIPDFDTDSRIVTLSAEHDSGSGNYVVQAVLDKTV
ncbi:MAG: class B sortase [Anaerovoracaceae bacterium]